MPASSTISPAWRDLCQTIGVWFHVDGAYGGAALAAPSARARFDGIEHADSFIVDPHKWLFAPFDCCALLYRDPTIAKAAHSQHAEYLDVLHDDRVSIRSGMPATTRITCRAERGVCRSGSAWPRTAPTRYRDAIESTLAVAHAGAELIRASDHCELVLEPELSIVVFRRIGWTPEQYQAWSHDQLASQAAFVVPTSWNGETVLRYCVVNPLTTLDDIAAIIESLR